MSIYVAAWDSLELSWKGLKRQPIPEEWKRYSSRSSLANGTKPKNKNASHPVNAMLNYGYAVLQRQMQIEAVAEGYDPTIGIMHKPKKGSPAYALDLMEPLRPIVDRTILNFVQSETFSGKDFAIQGNGVCRLNPELARRVVQVVGLALSR